MPRISNRAVPGKGAGPRRNCIAGTIPRSRGRFHVGWRPFGLRTRWLVPKPFDHARGRRRQGTMKAFSLFDAIRQQALLFEEASRIGDLVIERVMAPAMGSASSPPSEDGGLPALLRKVQLLFLRHPVAAQAAFVALLAEGRRFAA